MDSRQILPSMYKRNLRKEKLSKIFRTKFRRNAQNGDWKEQCDLLS